MRKLFPNFSYKHITFAIVDTTNYNQQPHVSDLENPLNDAVKLNKLNTNIIEKWILCLILSVG